jgi:thiol reductant ABC exporter CydD subunit
VRAIDPRLASHARATKGYLVVSVVLGTATAVLVVAQAWLLATVIAGAVVNGKNLADLRAPVEVLLGVVILRALVVWYSAVSANRCSARVKSQLRAALVERVASGAAGPTATGAGDLAALATHGIDALDGYFSRYLPQLALAIIVPLTVLVAIVRVDWESAAIVAVTLPLVPLFMALIGLATRARTDRQLRTLQVLSGHFLDVVGGLTTLKIFGRSKAQVATIKEVADRYRQSTMTTLRLAFLSSLVLEVLASISVALVAVSVGLRLLDGHMDLRSALFVLVLAPEAYLPLRLVGTNFHASAEGMSVAEQVFEVLDQPVASTGTRTDIPDPATHRLVVEDLCVMYPGADRAALDPVSLSVEPGEVLAITGPSGCGKSTLLGVLLGFVAPQAGSVHINGVELSALDPDAWRGHIAWVPQRPHLFATSIADNLRLGRPDASPAALARAIADAGLSDLIARLPLGLDTHLGEGGAGLSAGERQRIALARAFVRDAPLLLLDEPTANLDGETEACVVEAVGRLSRGRTVVMVAHRPALVALADRVVQLSPARLPA